MQQLSRNRFVSPTTAGTMDSARLGILMAILFFPTASMLLKTTIAVIVSFLGTLLFMTILSRLKFKDTIFVPLVGIMFGNIIGSITAFIAYKEDLLQNLSGWLQGDFSLVMSGRYELLYFSIPTLIVAYLFAHRFSIVGMGERFYRQFRSKLQPGTLSRIAHCGGCVLDYYRVCWRDPFLGINYSEYRHALFRG